MIKKIPRTANRFILAVLSMAAAAAVATAEPPEPVRLPNLAKLKILSQGIGMSHRIDDLVYLDGMVYATTQVGLDIYEPRGNNDLVLTQTVTYPKPNNQTRWIDANDKIIAVPAGWEGVYLFDRGTKGTIPKIMSTVRTDFDSTSVAIAGNILYVGGNRDDKMWFLTFDISNPAAAKPLARLQATPRGAWRTVLTQRDGFAYFYAADGDKTRCFLTTIDARVPAAPVITDTKTDIYDSANRIMAIGGDKLYVGAVEPNRILTFSLANAAKPTLIGTTPFYIEGWGGGLYDLVYAAGRLFAIGNRVFSIFDIGKDGLPTRVYSETEGIHNSDWVGYIATDGKEAYVADHFNYLKRVSLADPTKPRFVSQSKSETDILHTIDEYDGSLYAAGDQNLLEVYNLDDPAKPTLDYRMEDTNYCSYQVGIYQGLLFIPHYHFGLYVRDLTDDFEATVNISNLGLSGWLHAWPLDVCGKQAAVFNNENRIVVLDVSKPGIPKLIKAVKAQNYSDDLVLDPRGKHVYVFGEDSTLRVYGLEATDGESPVASLKLPERVSGFRSTIVDTTLYLSCHGSGLIAIDVADPRAPKILTSFKNFSNGTDVVAVRIYEDYALIANGWQGLVILRLSTGMSRTVKLPGYTKDVLAKNGYIYALSEQYGITTIGN